MLRLITCQRATLLLEQRAGQALPQGQRASLWLHLHYCRSCNRYATQSVQIAEWAHAAAAAHAAAGPPLPEAAKERMRRQLSAAG